MSRFVSDQAIQQARDINLIYAQVLNQLNERVQSVVPGS